MAKSGVPPGVKPQRGLNYTPPRRVYRREAYKPYWAWVVWCGWCRRDHTYPGRATMEVVKKTHTDRKWHQCRPKAMEREGWSDEEDAARTG